MTGTVAKLKQKYPSIEPRKEAYRPASPTIYLFMTWAYKVGKGWYGFDLEGVPFVWAKIINEFLTELDKVAPDFQINQIKLKFGGLRFYVDTKLEKHDAMRHDVQAEIQELEKWLNCKELIY